MFTEPRPSISPPLLEPVKTRADTASPATIDTQQASQFRQAWQTLIDQSLLGWLRDPSQLEDDGVEHPTPPILRLAIDWAEKSRDNGLPPADSIVPDANGGIVFQRRVNEMSEVFYIWDDGTLEYQRFHDTHLVERRSL